MDLAEERRTKHEAVVGFLEANDLDAVLLSRRCNVNWYTCGSVRNYVGTACDAGNTPLVVDRDGGTLVATNIEAERLEAEDVPETGLRVVRYPYYDADRQAEAMEGAVGDRRVAHDAVVGGVATQPMPAGFDDLRRTLTESEIARYREVTDDVVAAVESVCYAAEPGRSEYGLAGMLSAGLRRRGLVPWVLLVAADDRVERFRHPLPTHKKVERYFMLVTCAERHGLIAACTRLAHFGSIPEDLQAKHVAVSTVDAALASATRPDNTLGDAFAEAQAAYDELGHGDEWTQHHQGGTTGYLPREIKPSGPEDATPIRAFQALAWNPSITGTKSEDTIVCLPDRTEPLAARTDWPQIKVEWKGFTSHRPVILER